MQIQQAFKWRCFVFTHTTATVTIHFFVYKFYALVFFAGGKYSPMPAAGYAQRFGSAFGGYVHGARVVGQYQISVFAVAHQAFYAA